MPLLFVSLMLFGIFYCLLNKKGFQQPMKGVKK